MCCIGSVALNESRGRTLYCQRGVQLSYVLQIDVRWRKALTGHSVCTEVTNDYCSENPDRKKWYVRRFGDVPSSGPMALPMAFVCHGSQSLCRHRESHPHIRSTQIHSTQLQGCIGCHSLPKACSADENL